MSKTRLILNSINIYPLVRLRDEIDECIGKTETDVEKAGLIKFFELAYEQAWKILKKVLREHQGIEASSPRDVFRDSAKVGYIKDPETWFSFIKTRNETVHTYNENIVDHIIDEIPEFQTELNTLIKTLENLK